MTEITFITPAYLAMIPVVIGLTGAIKLIKGFNTSYSPIVAIVAGIGLAALLGGGAAAIVIGGIVIGLSASGLYSSTSAIKNEIAPGN